MIYFLVIIYHSLQINEHRVDRTLMRIRATHLFNTNHSPTDSVEGNAQWCGCRVLSKHWLSQLGWRWADVLRKTTLRLRCNCTKKHTQLIHEHGYNRSRWSQSQSNCTWATDTGEVNHRTIAPEQMRGSYCSSSSGNLQSFPGLGPRPVYQTRWVITLLTDKS